LPIAPNAFAKGNLPFISEDISKSFPSGHETMAAIGFYSLVLLPYTTTYFNTKKWKALLIPLAIIGSGIVGVGRLMAGAHYLSDVTIGSTIAIGLLTIFYVQNCYFASHLNT
jgi:membrane-associated phospholipid phosphatase